MTTKLVYRDSAGVVINIGEWDFMESIFTDPDSGEEVYRVQHNPIPDGATSAEEEIVTLDDGGLAAANP